MVTGGEVPKNAMKAKMLKISLLLPQADAAWLAKKFGFMPRMNRSPKRGDRCPIERDRRGRS
jgi:hypothetical protein